MLFIDDVAPKSNAVHEKKMQRFVNELTASNPVVAASHPFSLMNWTDTYSPNIFASGTCTWAL